MTGVWHPDAWIVQGPGWKSGYADIPQRDWRGGVFHSMEGPMTVGLLVLLGAAPLSWHFSVPKYGESFYQHYPIYKATWANGGPGANRRFFSIEHEGYAGEPLTEHQIECDVAIITWAMDNDVRPWPCFAREDTLFEHSEMVRFGSSPTACPSGRIPWQEVINMSMLFQELKARVRSLEVGNGWQQGALDLHKQQIEDIQTRNELQQGALNNHEERIGLLEAARYK